MNKEPIYHSDIFWHFCGREKTEDEAFKSLCDILNEKCLKRSFHNSAPFEEPIKDRYGSNTLTWRIQYVCFADIPFEFLKHHIEMYGNVGLGFKKEFIIEKGGQPVLYTPYIEKNGKQRSAVFSISAIIEQWGKEWSQIIEKHQIKPEEYRDLGWKIQTVPIMKENGVLLIDLSLRKKILQKLFFRNVLRMNLLDCTLIFLMKFQKIY